MPTYKLHYFNARARAEPTRLCFAVAGVKYEDIRCTHEEWQKMKQDGFSPMGCLPVLEVDGKKLCETMAIVKYLGKQFGLCPSDNFEVAQCDQFCAAFEGLMAQMANLMFIENDVDRKKVLEKKFYNEQVPVFLTNVTALLKSNNDGKGFFVGKKLSYADIVLFNCCNFKQIVGSQLENFPELKAHSARIGEIPGIKKWIKNRPDTQM